jgi:transposase
MKGEPMIRNSTPLEIRVGIDVGCHNHSVAIGLSSGELLDEFEIAHRPEGFQQFFAHIERLRQAHDYPVAVAMEGYNGHARPLDTLILVQGYHLFNINNLKLARFKEIFPAAAKTDEIDARKALELFQLRDMIPTAKGVLQEVGICPEENAILKRLTRRRRRLVNERVRLLNSLQDDLHAVCPGLLEITNDAGNLWFLNFLTSTNNLPKLARLRRSSLQKIQGVGIKYASLIQGWQKRAQFSPEVKWTGELILEDATRILELHAIIKALENKMETVSKRSQIATLLSSLQGFGPISTTELAGEIGTIERFASENSLAVYLGMSPLRKDSGKHKGSKPPKHVNSRAKAAMMVAVDRHRKQVPQSQRYYLKKRSEGKSHNQAIRTLGRHLCRAIFNMLKLGKPYEIRG